jgi:predicted site-specific integrase-resolvase
MNKEYISIGEAANKLGVSVCTLRRWEKNEKLKSRFRTFGNHRRYYLHDINKMLNSNEKKTICYSRVSSYDQKKDLIIQDKKLRKYCKDNNFKNVESICDLGSGLNFNKKGLKLLINMILNQEISSIIINHKERLLRFGTEILFKMCDFFDIKIIIIEEKIKDFNQDLTERVIEIMTVFCAKLYGSRSHKNKKSLES